MWLKTMERTQLKYICVLVVLPQYAGGILSELSVDQKSCDKSIQDNAFQLIHAGPQITFFETTTLKQLQEASLTNIFIYSNFDPTFSCNLQGLYPLHKLTKHFLLCFIIRQKKFYIYTDCLFMINSWRCLRLCRLNKDCLVNFSSKSLWLII